AKTSCRVTLRGWDARTRYSFCGCRRGARLAALPLGSGLGNRPLRVQLSGASGAFTTRLPPARAADTAAAAASANPPRAPVDEPAWSSARGTEAAGGSTLVGSIRVHVRRASSTEVIATNKKVASFTTESKLRRAITGMHTPGKARSPRAAGSVAGGYRSFFAVLLLYP